jgi:hypothetical protein
VDLVVKPRVHLQKMSSRHCTTRYDIGTNIRLAVNILTSNVDPHLLQCGSGYSKSQAIADPCQSLPSQQKVGFLHEKCTKL